MKRRDFISYLGMGTLGAVAGLPKLARAQTPGVTASEIKIGHTNPYSGPASSYGIIGKAHAAFFQMVNDQGGVSGRKINFISLDDGYQPAKTVEQTRRLVEQEEVAFLFNQLGTLTNTAVQRYLNQKKVPQLFVGSGAAKWANPKDFPWTIGWQPSFQTEAQVYVKYVLKEYPNAKIAIIYQNDDFGKDYLNGVKAELGNKFNQQVVKVISYEATDATIDSQAVTLRDSGADVLITAAIPKFASQMIRKIFDMGWKPVHLISNASASVGTVINPAGAEKAVGLLTGFYLKDPTDAAWQADAGMNEWRAFMKKYVPDGDLNDGNYVLSYGVCCTMLQVLKQCGDDFSRENIMKQALSLKNLDIPALIPGIRASTGASDYQPVKQLQLAKWNGKSWERFGDVISAD